MAVNADGSFTLDFLGLTYTREEAQGYLRNMEKDKREGKQRGASSDNTRDGQPSSSHTPRGLKGLKDANTNR
jgi:hypothetical protein